MLGIVGTMLNVVRHIVPASGEHENHKSCLDLSDT